MPRFARRSVAPCRNPIAFFVSRSLASFFLRGRMAWRALESGKREGRKRRRRKKRLARSSRPSVFFFKSPQENGRADARTHARMHARTHARTHWRLGLKRRVHTHALTRAAALAASHTRAYTHMHTRARTHTRTHTHTHTNLTRRLRLQRLQRKQVADLEARIRCVLNCSACTKS